MIKNRIAGTAAIFTFGLAALGGTVVAIAAPANAAPDPQPTSTVSGSDSPPTNITIQAALTSLIDLNQKARETAADTAAQTKAATDRLNTYNRGLTQIPVRPSTPANQGPSTPSGPSSITSLNSKMGAGLESAIAQSGLERDSVK